MKAGEQAGLEREIVASLVRGYLPCPVALNLSRRLGVGSKKIGDAVDTLGIRITNCQLGCFKVEKARHENLKNKVISKELMDHISKSLVSGRLPCLSAHNLSQELKLNLKEIGDAATKMNVKIVDCQLGCFS